MTINDDTKLDYCDQVAAYEINMLKVYGAVVGGDDLYRLLGYSSGDSFRHASSRGTLPVATFKRKGFRHRFARTRDIAKWLVAIGKELRLESGHLPAKKKKYFMNIKN